MCNDEEEYLILPKKVRLIHDYLPYTPCRIKRILKEMFDYRLENIWQGYKANRYPGYVEKYQLIENGTERVVNPCITLDQIRHIFANADVPLYDEKSSYNQTGRNQGAERFLEAVNNLKDSTKED